MRFILLMIALCCGQMLLAQIGPTNSPPTISVKNTNGSISSASTVNVAYNDTLSTWSFAIGIDDADNDNVKVSTSITNLGSTGILTTEWSSASKPVAYTMYPSTGTFNTVAGVTHVVTITAKDGSTSTAFTFNIQQAAQSGGSNSAPAVVVHAGSTSIGNGGTHNVAYNDVVSGEFRITISDADTDNTSCATTITNLGSTGIVTSEWSSASQAVSYALYPSTGTFNTVAGVTHVVTITANDGTTTTTFTLNIVQAAQPAGNTAPTIGVSASASLVSNGTTLNVAYNDTVSTQSYSIVINDADADNTSCTTTISSTGSTGMLTSEWSSGSAAVSYTLTPSTGTFNTIAGVTHTVSITADDGTDQTTFTFYINQAAQPGPSIGVSDGAAVANGASAGTSNRAFGSQLITAGPTSAVTITISNSGGAALTLGTPSITGSGNGEFVLDTTGISGSVASSGSTSFTVSFDPSSAGSFAATVEFTHNDGSTTTPFTFEVTGTGTTPAPAPILVVRDTDASGAVIGNGSAASGTRDFGTVLISGIPTANSIVHLKNEGNADLIMALPTFSGSGFTVDTSNFNTTLTAGSSCTISFALTTITAGSYAATISFTHNDATTTTPFSFDLAGTVDDGSISFGSGGGGGGSGGCIAADSHTALWAILLLLGSAALMYRRRKLA